LLFFCFVVSWRFSGTDACGEFKKFVASYNEDEKDISTLYPVEFNQLYQKVQKHLTREELKTVLSKKVGIELE